MKNILVAISIAVFVWLAGSFIEVISQNSIPNFQPKYSTYNAFVIFTDLQK